MKGFLITLILLIIIAGTVFFFGWIQLRIDADEYAVIFTKTQGWESDVIWPGSFAWRWEAVVPSMLTLYNFSLAEHSTTFSFAEDLPGSELYESFSPASPNFSWSFDIGVSYSIRPEYLPELAEQRDIRPDTLEEYIELQDTAIESQILDSFYGFFQKHTAESGNDDQVIVPQTSALRSYISDELIEYFPSLDIQQVIVNNVSLPDIELYTLARQRYQGVLDAETQARQAAIGEMARIELITRLQQESLGSLAQMFRDNPSLLEYLRIVGETGRDPVGLSPLFTSALSSADFSRLNSQTLQAVEQQN